VWAIRKILRTLPAITVGDALTKDADAVVNFAAETHVDRSIEDPSPSSNKRAGNILST